MRDDSDLRHVITIVTMIREARINGRLIDARVREQHEVAHCVRVWYLAIGEGLFGEFDETTTAFPPQRIDADGFSRLGNELGDRGEIEADSRVDRLKSDWKYWKGLLRSQKWLTYGSTARRGVKQSLWHAWRRLRQV